MTTQKTGAARKGRPGARLTSGSRPSFGKPGSLDRSPLGTEKAKRNPPCGGTILSVARKDRGPSEIVSTDGHLYLVHHRETGKRVDRENEEFV
jgi:hypothetical protein